MPKIWQERKLKERSLNESFEEKTGLIWDTGHLGLLCTVCVMPFLYYAPLLKSS